MSKALWNRMISAALVVGLGALAGCKVTMGPDIPRATPRPDPTPIAFVQSNQWTPQKSGVTTDLNALAVLDSERCVVVGDQGTLLKTFDGGLTWKSIATEAMKGQDLIGVHFLDALNGWVASENLLFRTTNGGLDWALQHDFQADKTAIQAVKFGTATTGYALAQDRVLRTSDGGQSWTVEPVGTEERLYGLEAIGNDAWVAGQKLYKRSAAGNWVATFAEAQLGERHGGLDFTSPLVGWLVRKGPTDLFKTSDGGQTWSQAAPRDKDGKPLRYGDGTTRAFDNRHIHVHFVDAQRGWIVAGPYLLHTTDGGRVWTPGALRTNPPDFSAVQMADRNYGWGVGAKGLIVRHIGLQV